MIILAGDIGGTHSRLALADSTGLTNKAKHNHLTLTHITQLVNSEFSQPSDLLRHYFDLIKLKPDIACLAIAAPVPNRDGNNEQTVRLTNLPWVFSNTRLKHDFGLNDVYLINDFAGLPYITRSLTSLIAHDDIRVIQSANAKTSTPVEFIFGAGTGLGCAISTGGRSLTVLGSEAGHSDISGASQQLRQIIQYLEQNSIRPCWENVLSGNGLERLFAYLSNIQPDSPHTKTARQITRQAPLIPTGMEFQTLELFLNLAGIFSQNMALNCLPDNIYLVGNIFRLVFDIVPVEKFLKGFHSTTQHNALLNNIPITLILDTQVGLKGAVAFALDKLDLNN